MNSFISLFKSPPKEDSPLAFWFWNGTLETQKLAHQIQEMFDKGVYGAFMHARPFLKTPYLEREWWDAVGACVEKSKEIGFFPWLYDEYAWPSGTAGSTFELSYQKPSRVLAQGRQNMAKGLTVKKYSCSKAAVVNELIREESADFIAAFMVSERGEIKPIAIDETADGQITAFFVELYPQAVDYLNKEAVKYFIELTHEEYRKRYGDYFGTLIPGIFFDEIYMSARLPWTDKLPQEFEDRCGYSLMPFLPALIEEGGEEAKRIRADYFRVIAELYEEAFFLQLSQWSEKNNLMLTGHTEENLSGHPSRQGNYFNTMRHLQIPGADNHDYRYRFPRKISCVEPKYSVSVARAYNRERAMSEAMGGAGWGCSLQQFKRGINTMAAMGINMFVLHAFYYESDHQGSQSDWPTSFFYQNPYWKYFKIFAQYINRVCFMNTQGNAVVEVGLFYPIYDMQIGSVDGGLTKTARQIDQAFHTALYTLLERQIDTDLIDEESLLKAAVDCGTVQAGRQRFKVLLFPHAAAISPALSAKLEEFTASGGKVLFYHDDPASTESVCAASALAHRLDTLFTPDILILEGGRSNIYTCHRRIETDDVYYISNSSNKSRRLKLQVRGAGKVWKMDIETAQVYPIRSTITETNNTVVSLSLDEDEACYLLLSQDAQEQEPALELEEREEIALSSLWTLLPLDKSFDSRYGIDGDSTELQIPLATFAGDLCGGNKLIRICNKEGEQGSCARHLSLWKASWVARRAAWYCGADSDLYFRRIVEVEDKPNRAPVCLAAINEYTLYVNGKALSCGKSGGAPVSTDIAGALRKGRNCIAVHIHNDNPSNSFSAIHEVPKERITAFLFQAEIRIGERKTELLSDGSWIVTNRFHEGWQNLEADYEDRAYFADATHASTFWQGAKEGQWLYAWERGTPPVHPWGDLPLFGQEPSFPRRLTYGITIPSGTRGIKKPVVRGEYACTLDGVPLCYDGEWAKTDNDGRTHYLNIQVTASGREDGLQYPVTVSVSPFRVSLGDWRLYGYLWFSGRIRYRNTVYIEKREGVYVIDLGQVNFSAEIWVNNRLAGVRLWSPYRLDITDQVQDGENHITIVAANSAAVERRHTLVDEGRALGWARYWNEDNIDREGENLVSGLLGPVRIFHRQAGSLL